MRFLSALVASALLIASPAMSQDRPANAQPLPRERSREAVARASTAVKPVGGWSRDVARSARMAREGVRKGLGAQRGRPRPRGSQKSRTAAARLPRASGPELRPLAPQAGLRRAQASARGSAADERAGYLHGRL